MKKLLPLLFLLISSCTAEDGSGIDYVNTFLVFAVIVIFIGIVYTGNKQKEKEDLENAEFVKYYKNAFQNHVSKNNLKATNTLLNAPFFGLAISDAKDCIAYFSKRQDFRVIPVSKLVSSSIQVNSIQQLNSKTKAPIVTWNTSGNTKGTLTNIFESADINITVDDLENPHIKLTVSDMATAEKYNALINVLIASK